MNVESTGEPRFYIEDSREGVNTDPEDAFNMVKYQHDLYVAADDFEGVRVRCCAMDGDVIVRVIADDPDVLRTISRKAGQPWLAVFDADDNDLPSAEDQCVERGEQCADCTGRCRLIQLRAIEQGRTVSGIPE